MEFPFKVNCLFHREIVKLEKDLVPENSTGNRREYEEAVVKVSHILDEMGQASAEAQGLNLPITSGERLRTSNQTVYLFTDPDGAQGSGTVVGLLKMGKKDLFLFDETGAHHEIQALCVLDFYIHESKQRLGYGKLLYEHMLKEENIKPHHLAIDRPSLKFLRFMQKHYGLEKILPQSNNFVVFDGFFTDRPESPNKSHSRRHSEFVPAGFRETTCPVRRIDHTNAKLDQLHSPQNTGRYAAYKPPSTVGKILQTGTVSSLQRNGNRPKSLPVPLSVESSQTRSITSPHYCRFDNDGTPTAHRDLKFYHSPLW